VSGINAGANCGQAVLHSGTVGAALTAATFGLSGLAVSIVHSRRREIQWQTAGLLARGAAEWLIEAEPGSVLNLNVPNRQIGELEGVLGAPLSKIGTVQSSLFDEGNGRVRVQQERAVPEPGSDSAIVLDGKAALTLLSPICGHPTEMAASCVSEVLLQKRSPLARA
jgi:5'-nucleotidase